MRINSKKIALANLDKFNLKQYLYDAKGLYVNDAMEKILKDALYTILADDLVGLWKYPITVPAKKTVREKKTGEK